MNVVGIFVIKQWNEQGEGEPENNSIRTGGGTTRKQ